MEVTSIKIGGTEFLHNALLRSTDITRDSGGRASEATVVLTQQTGDPAFSGMILGWSNIGECVFPFVPPQAPNDDVIIEAGGARIFSGTIARRVFELDQQIDRYRFSCHDKTRMLDTVMIEHELFTSQTDEEIIDALFAAYLPSIGTGNVQGVADIDSLEIQDISLREAMERIQERTGAVWYVDPDDELQYFEEGTQLAPFNISENDPIYYPLAGTVSYEEDFSNPANRVTVKGIGSETTSAVETYEPPNTSDDGRTTRTNTVWPPDAGPGSSNTTASQMAAANEFGAGTYLLTVSMVRFDTSSIPDAATILSATLKLWVDENTSANAADAGFEYYDPANWPIGSGDYTSVPSNSAAGYIPLFSFITGGYNNIVLTSPNANINKSGYTGFRIHVRTSGAPTGLNRLTVQTFDGSNKPKLEVAYAVTSAGVQVTEEDTVSQGIYGVFERTLIDRKIQSEAEASLRAMVELSRYAYPQRSGAMKIRNDGLGVGQLLRVSLPSFDVDDDFIIRKLQARWITQDVTEYQVEFGDYRPDQIQFMRKLFNMTRRSS